MSKPYQFKAPPSLCGIFPLLLSYGVEVRPSKDMSGAAKRLHIDFSHVEEFDALGISIFLANLSKEVRGQKQFEFQLKYPPDKSASELLTQAEIGRFLFLIGMDENPNGDLWGNAVSSADRSKPSAVTFDGGRQLILFTPRKQSESDRASLTFARKAFKAFYADNPAANINYHQLQHVLDEIVKNTIDHSDDCGITALKFSANPIARIDFAHCELGGGISLGVRNFLASSDKEDYQRLASRGSTADFLHWAFLPGHTSRPNSGVNAGLGLSHIQSACKGGNIKMYLSDAQSIAYVTDFPEEYSHKQLRRRLYHTAPIPCFMYFGGTR